MCSSIARHAPSAVHATSIVVAAAVAVHFSQEQCNATQMYLLVQMRLGNTQIIETQRQLWEATLSKCLQQFC